MKNSSSIICSLLGGVILGAAITCVIAHKGGYENIKKNIKDEVGKMHKKCIKMYMESKIKGMKEQMGDMVSATKDEICDCNDPACECNNN